MGAASMGAMQWSVALMAALLAASWQALAQASSSGVAVTEYSLAQYQATSKSSALHLPPVPSSALIAGWQR